jgi:hypothetical protein
MTAPTVTLGGLFDTLVEHGFEVPLFLASRIQFGWTISVHILFASLSIGLALPC